MLLFYLYALQDSFIQLCYSTSTTSNVLPIRLPRLEPGLGVLLLLMQ